MNFIHAENSDGGAHELSAKIVASLKQGKRTLWLVPGGSNIRTAVAVMHAVREGATIGELANLTVSLTDERYGPVGHPDSNWRQLEDAGFDFDNVTTIPVLRDRGFKETAAAFGKDMIAAFTQNEVRIAQLGIGPDGHIAGILPGSPAVTDSEAVVAYEAGKFQRITLTPVLLANLSAGYAFAFGASKAEALKNLKDSPLSLAEEPAQLLKALPEAYLWSDQV